jgi:hypothetical protein
MEAHVDYKRDVRLGILAVKGPFTIRDSMTVDVLSLKAKSLNVIKSQDVEVNMSCSVIETLGLEGSANVAVFGIQKITGNIFCARSSNILLLNLKEVEDVVYGNCGQGGYHPQRINDLLTKIRAAEVRDLVPLMHDPVVKDVSFLLTLVQHRLQHD